MPIIINCYNIIICGQIGVAAAAAAAAARMCLPHFQMKSAIPSNE